MLGEENHLPDVLRVVRNLAIDGLQYSVRLAPDGDRAHYVFGFQRVNSSKDYCPTVFPPLHDIGAAGGWIELPTLRKMPIRRIKVE